MLLHCLGERVARSERVSTTERAVRHDVTAVSTAAGVFASPDAVLTNSSGAYGVTIAEHIVMCALEMLRRQMDYSAIVRRREWKRDLPVRSIKGSRVILLGTGDIGREAAIRLRAFGPASLVGVNRGGGNPQGLFDRIVLQDALDSVLPETDILVISLPGTPETFHMLGARRLVLLPDQALVINVGRGSVIDQKALEKELRAGRLCVRQMEGSGKVPNSGREQSCL